jgi:hypothetical protein
MGGDELLVEISMGGDNGAMTVVLSEIVFDHVEDFNIVFLLNPETSRLRERFVDLVPVGGAESLETSSSSGSSAGTVDSGT